MRALVLSGGGSKIHYLTGVVRELLGRRGIQYDLYAGASAGAVVAAHLAQYPDGFESDAAFDLEELLLRVTERDVRRRWWPFGRLHGLWKASFYSSAPLRTLLYRELSSEAIHGSGKKLRIGAVCAETGQLRIFDEKSRDLVAAVLAASAFPGMLEPSPIDTQSWIGAGVRLVTPLAAAIDAGAEEVDVVFTSPGKARVACARRSAFEVCAQALELMHDEIMTKDLQLARATNRMVEAAEVSTKRSVRIRVVRPDHVLSGSFDFSPESTAIMRVLGQQDARRALDG